MVDSAEVVPSVKTVEILCLLGDREWYKDQNCFGDHKLADRKLADHKLADKFLRKSNLAFQTPETERLCSEQYSDHRQSVLLITNLRKARSHLRKSFRRSGVIQEKY